MQVRSGVFCILHKSLRFILLKSYYEKFSCNHSGFDTA